MQNGIDFPVGNHIICRPLKPTEPQQIESVGDAVRLFSAPVFPDDGSLYKFGSRIWYRGHARLEWALNPGIFRGNKPERVMYNHFQRRVPEHRHAHQTVFEWLCLMQHYGLPTRLLDWSESVLSALYFVVGNDEHFDTDGLLIVLDANRLNEISHVTVDDHDISRATFICEPKNIDVALRAQFVNYGEIRSGKAYESFFYNAANESIPRLTPSNMVPLGNAVRSLFEKTGLPIAVYSSRLNPRISAQFGNFTLHGGHPLPNPKNDKDIIPLPVDMETLNDTLKASEPKFLKIYIVPQSAKTKIRAELRQLGIHQGTLFPELEHQSKYIVDQW